MEGLVRLTEKAMTNLLSGFGRKGGRVGKPEPMASRSKGFLVGTALPFDGSPERPGEPVLLDLEQLGKPTLIKGGTGTGKSTLMRALKAFEYGMGRTVVDVDFRGDGTANELRRLASMEEPPPVTLLDCGAEHHVPPFDFLAAGGGSPFARSGDLRRHVKAAVEGWGVRIDYNAAFAFQALAEIGLGLTEVRALLAEGGGLRSYALERLSDPSCRAALRDFDGLSPEQRLTQWQELANKLHPWLFQERTRLMLGAGESPDMGRMLDEPGRASLVSLGVSKLPAASILGRLLVSEIVRHVMARADREDRNFAAVYIDELSNLGDAGIEPILAEGRRLGCTVRAALQFSGQVPVTVMESFRANASVHVYFAAGAAEAAEDAKEIVCDLPREEVRRQLVSLGIGEAILVRRGMPACKVRLADPPVAKVSEAQLARFSARALSAGCAEIATVRAVLAARERWIEGLGNEEITTHISHGKRPSGRGRAGG